MSASLVGSEMCIRDRGPLFLRARVFVHGRVLASLRLATTLLRTASAMPVSYTHLTLPTICSV
eukprot:13049990-Alexandrium_andersonii.AAC.1